MTAKGFSSRLLRSRSRRTAEAEVASQARWKPPIPLTATMSPASRARAGLPIGSSQARRSPPGPTAVETRTAVRAGVGLGVEAPVGADRRTRAGTPRTLRKAPSSSPDRSYGTSARDREARPAIGAVGEGVAVAAIVRIEDLPADTRRRSAGPRGSRRAAPALRGSRRSRSPRRRLRRNRRPLELADPRREWSVLGSEPDEGLQSPGLRRRPRS